MAAKERKSKDDGDLAKNRSDKLSTKAASSTAMLETKQSEKQSLTRRTLLLLVLAILVGIIKWRFYDRFGIDQTVDETLKSMLSIESRVSINKDLNVAVGFGSCLDIYVSSKDLIFDQHQPPESHKHHENIRSQEDLNEVLTYFFVGGAAAERYIDNRTFFHELVERAQTVHGSRKAIGGNAAVMANRFVIEGIEKVILGTQHSRQTTNDYSDKLVVSGPLVDHDDVHICIEYPAGERWGEYVSPRANRFIIHSDFFNPTLKSLDNFINRIASAKTLDLLVIGGLQMLDNIPIPIETRTEKLQKLSQVLSGMVPNKPKIHLELASFTEELLLQSIENLIIPHVNSLGMNEQELPTLLKYLTKGGVNILSDAYPRVATTLDQMRQLYQILQKPTKGGLTRIHAHTLAFQAIMTRVDSGWKNTLTSSVKAALTAHRYTCGSHEIDMAKAKLIMDDSYTTSKQGSRRKIPFNPKHPVVCWQEHIPVEASGHPETGLKVPPQVQEIEICVAPVLVCTKVKQTAGAGDNVSAAGLIFQL